MDETRNFDGKYGYSVNSNGWIGWTVASRGLLEYPWRPPMSMNVSIWRTLMEENRQSKATMSKEVWETVLTPSRLRLSRQTGRKASVLAGVTHLSVIFENTRCQRFGRRDNMDLNLSVFIISLGRGPQLWTHTRCIHSEIGGSSRESLLLLVRNARNE